MKTIPYPILYDASKMPIWKINFLCNLYKLTLEADTQEIRVGTIYITKKPITH